MLAAQPRIVRFVIQLAESFRRFLRALATPSALCVPIPVTSSAERARRLPSSRAVRRF